MAIIDPQGLFHGERLCRCSNNSRLFWPYFFLLSNGFGRLELTYHKLLIPFLRFDPRPTEKEVEGYVSEYAANHLLYVYLVNGQVWGQWDCPSRLLRKYKTSEDRKSPTPPEPAFMEWKQSYRSDYNGFAKVSEKFSLGGGEGGGVGEEPMSEDEPPVSVSSLDSEGAWNYYLNAVGKSPKQNTFTPARKNQLRRRFDERVKIHEGDGAKAKLDIRNAIDSLFSSDFHNARGEHKGKKPFNSWEIIFRSQSQFEKWLPEGEEE